MVVNEEKTNFMAFNCSANDRRDIVLSMHAGDVIVNHCSQYTYLGAIVTSDGRIETSVGKHADSRANCINKLVRFLDKNKNAPFSVKKCVFDACVTSSLLYGCEAWLNEKSWSKINVMYMKGIKMLLGVRSTTTSDVCLLESGYPSLDALVKSRQKLFFKNMISERKDMSDDPLMHSINITHSDNPVLSQYINSLLQHEGDFIDIDMKKRKERVLKSKATKLVTYRSINPTLEIHPIYKGKSKVDDYLRVAFTRLRTSSHRLRIETGRWSRIEPDRRLCQCGLGVQTERHALCECVLVNGIRERYGCAVIDFDMFMCEEKASYELLMLYEILKSLER